jgi:hypothetical protein
VVGGGVDVGYRFCVCFYNFSVEWWNCYTSGAGIAYPTGAPEFTPGF